MDDEEFDQMFQEFFPDETVNNRDVAQMLVGNQTYICEGVSNI